MNNEYFKKYGYPLFYEDERMYAMTDKRSYKDILANVETHFIYINNHLDNIDKHLEKQNNSLTEHGKSIARNSTWLSAVKYTVYIIIVVLIGSITATKVGLW